MEILITFLAWMIERVLSLGLATGALIVGISFIIFWVGLNLFMAIWNFFVRGLSRLPWMPKLPTLKDPWAHKSPWFLPQLPVF